MAAAFVVISIVAVWGLLLGAATLSRGAGRGRGASVAIVTVAYLAVAAAALGWFGLTRSGALGVFGMLFPYAVALGLVLLPRRAV